MGFRTLIHGSLMNIFLDLDQTLFDTMSIGMDEETPNPVILLPLYERYDVVLRPDAEKLLAMLSSMGSLRTCTSASYQYATEILGKLNLSKMFDDIIAREHLIAGNVEFRDSLKNEFILIDDAELWSTGMNLKLRYLCAPEQNQAISFERHVVPVSPFFRGGDVQPVTEIIQAVDSKIQAVQGMLDELRTLSS